MAMRWGYWLLFLGSRCCTSVLKARGVVGAFSPIRIQQRHRQLAASSSWPLHSTSPRRRRPESSSSAATRSSGKTSKTRKKTGARKGRPRSRLLKSTTALSNRQTTTSPTDSFDATPRRRPTSFEANRNDYRTNQERLQGSGGCEHFGSCSGCVVNDQVGAVPRVQAARRYFSSTAIRQKRWDLKVGGHPQPQWGRRRSYSYDDDDNDDDFFQVVVPSPLTGWRTQAKLVAAPAAGSSSSASFSRWSQQGGGCRFGLYQRGTHDVLAIPNCAVHHPAINRAVELLQQATATAAIVAYDEATREGPLRFVQLQVDRTTDTVCVTFVWNAETLKDTHPALTRLQRALLALDKSLWHSMWCHCNNGAGNNIFHRSPNRRWHRLWGLEAIREPLPGAEYGYCYFTPLNFRQANHGGFDVLALDVARQAIPGGSKVCELYAGVGVLGLTALAYHQDQDTPLQWLRCSDVNPANPSCFAKAVQSLPPDVTNHAPPRTRRGHKTKQRHRRSENQEEETMTMAELARMMQDAADDEDDSIPRIQEEGPKTSYLVASAAEALHKGQALGADVLLVDPPRKGLEEAVLQELCKPVNHRQQQQGQLVVEAHRHNMNWVNDVTTLVYVSCGFDALARDTDQLLSSPAGWLLQSATGYVLFPGSDHVETVCVFRRR